MTKMDACIYINRQQEILRHTGTPNINMQTYNNYTIQHKTFMAGNFHSYEENSCFLRKHSQWPLIDLRFLLVIVHKIFAGHENLRKFSAMKVSCYMICKHVLTWTTL